MIKAKFLEPLVLIDSPVGFVSYPIPLQLLIKRRYKK